MKKLFVAALIVCGGFPAFANVETFEASAGNEVITNDFYTAIKCESWDRNYRQCYFGRFSGYVRSVQVVDQHSRSRCDYGYSWGVTSQYIWVDHGCRATFQILVD